MSVRKIRNSWWVDFRHEFTRYRKRSPENSQAGAKAYEASLRARLMKAENINKRPKADTTFAAFSTEWLNTYARTNNKPSEQRNKEAALRVHLVPWFRHATLSAIAARNIEEFKAAKLKIGLSPKTVNNLLMVLRKCLGSAMDWDLLERAPKIQLLRAPSFRLDYLTDEESEQLLEDKAEPMWNDMVLMAAHTGMRQGELFGLEWDSVDLDRRLITVCRSNFRGHVTSPKGHRTRYIPMSERLFHRLWANRGHAGVVFRRANTAMLNHNMAACALRRICKRTGVRRITWHVLRHSFATSLVAKGVPLRAVQELLGHSSITRTERYAHVAPSSLQSAISLLDTGAWVGGQPVGNAQLWKPQPVPASIPLSCINPAIINENPHRLGEGSHGAADRD